MISVANEPVDTSGEVLAPHTEMTIDSLVDVYKFYKEYAMIVGFSVAKRSSNFDREGNVQSVLLICSCEGKRRTSKAHSGPKFILKTKCLTRIHASICSDGKWVLISLFHEHNHPLSPSKSRFFPCNRTLPSNVKRRLELNDQACVRMNQSFNSFVVEAGGHEALKFVKRDCHNHIAKARQLRLRKGDVEAVTVTKRTNYSLFLAFQGGIMHSVKN